MLKVGIVGLGGRMGHALWDCCLGLDGAKVVCGIDKTPIHYHQAAMLKL